MLNYLGYLDRFSIETIDVKISFVVRKRVFFMTCYVEISTSASISTGAPKGSSAIPTAERE